MKILCTGGSGQLGRCIKDQFSTVSDAFDISFPSRVQLDLADANSIKSYLSDSQFDLLILSGAYTQVDQAEDEKELAYKINAESTHVFIEYAQKHNIPVVYISTDYVYNKTTTGSSFENDPLAPQNVYGTSKLKGEEVVQKHGQHYILRTSWLYSSYGHNFLKTMLKLAQNRNELGVVIDQVGTPTYAGHLAELIKELVLTIKSIKQLDYGIYNYSDEGIASWYDFAHYIFEQEQIEIKLNPVDSSQFPTKAKRPHNSLMSKEKIRNWGQHQIKHWHLGVKECLKQLKNERI